jgi:hypothetical protein
MKARSVSGALVAVGRGVFGVAARAVAVVSLSLGPVLLVALPASAQTAPTTAPAAGGAVSATPSGAALGAAAQSKIQAVINTADQGALWASLLSIFAGAGAWGLSKHFGSYSGAHKGQLLVLGGAAGALLAAMAPSIINGLFGA